MARIKITGDEKQWAPIDLTHICEVITKLAKLTTEDRVSWDPNFYIDEDKPDLRDEDDTYLLETLKLVLTREGYVKLTSMLSHKLSSIELAIACDHGMQIRHSGAAKHDLTDEDHSQLKEKKRVGRPRKAKKDAAPKTQKKRKVKDKMPKTTSTPVKLTQENYDYQMELLATSIKQVNDTTTQMNNCQSLWKQTQHGVVDQDLPTTTDEDDDDNDAAPDADVVDTDLDGTVHKKKAKDDNDDDDDDTDADTYNVQMGAAAKRFKFIDYTEFEKVTVSNILLYSTM